MKKSTLILLISTAIFFTSTLYLLFLNFQKPKESIVKTQMPTVIPTKAIDPTANWKTYTDKNWDYSVKYPADWKVVSFEKPTIDIMPTTSDDRNLGSINLSLTMNQETPDVPPSFTDFSNVDPSTCGNSTWAVKNNKNDSFACWKYNRDVWFIPTYSSVVTKDIYSQIMSTFKFIPPDYLLEDGSTYRVIDNYLSWDNCGSEDNETSLKIKQKISALAQVSEKEINGLKIISTISLGFTSADIKQFYLCQAGAFSPLKVLPNKILWISSCGTGAYWDGVEKCEETRTAIQKLYKL